MDRSWKTRRCDSTHFRNLVNMDNACTTYFTQLESIFHQLKELLNPKIIIETLWPGRHLCLPRTNLHRLCRNRTGGGLLSAWRFLAGRGGLFAAAGKLNVFVLLRTLFVAAVVGDAVGYYTGLKVGPRLFYTTEVAALRPSHLQKAHAFYEKYGGKTIIIARFVPIVRTFAPIVAGAAEMPYRVSSSSMSSAAFFGFSA